MTRDEQIQTIKSKLVSKQPIDATEMVTLAEIADEIRPPFVIDDLFIANGKAILYGKPKRHKTNLAIYLSLSIAYGKPVLDGRATTPKRVLYLSTEQPLVYLSDRASKMIRSAFLDMPSGLWQVLFLSPEDRNANTIDRLVSENKPELVVIDCLYNLIGTEDQDKIMPWLAYFDRLIEKYNIALILVHHRRKGMGNPDGSERLDNIVDDIRGSSKFGSWANLIMGVVRKTPMKKDDIELGFEYRDSARGIENIAYHFDRDTCVFRLTLTQEETSKSARTSAKREKVKEWMRQNRSKFQNLTIMVGKAQEIFDYKPSWLWHIWREVQAEEMAELGLSEDSVVEVIRG